MHNPEKAFFPRFIHSTYSPSFRILAVDLSALLQTLIRKNYMKKYLSVVLMLASGLSQASDLRALADWQPKGWNLLAQAEGDLNADKIPDVVLVVEETDPKKIIKNEGMGPPMLDQNPRRIMVLIREGDLYRNSGQSDLLIPSKNPSPCRDDPFAEVEVKGGLLKLTESFFASCGTWSSSRTTYTFRLEAGRMRLIGEDSDEFMRNSGEKTLSSTNYLTGKRKLVTGLNEFDEFKPVKPKTRWESLPPSPAKYLDEL